MKTRLMSVFVVSLFAFFSPQVFAEYYVVSGMVPEYEYESPIPGYMIAETSAVRSGCGEYPCRRYVVAAPPCGYTCRYVVAKPRYHRVRHKPCYVKEVVRVYRRPCSSYYGCDNRRYEGSEQTLTYEWVSP